MMKNAAPTQNPLEGGHRLWLPAEGKDGVALSPGREKGGAGGAIVDL